MGHVLPLGIVLDGVIELGGAAGERKNAAFVRAPASLRIRIRIQNAVLNSTLNAFPLLLWRLFFHPPNIISVFGRKRQKNLLPAHFLQPTVETSLHRFRFGIPYLGRNLGPVVPSSEHLENKPHLSTPFIFQTILDRIQHDLLLENGRVPGRIGQGVIPDLLVECFEGRVQLRIFPSPPVTHVQFSS